jgi:hypothetical protein
MALSGILSLIAEVGQSLPSCTGQTCQASESVILSFRRAYHSGGADREPRFRTFNPQTRRAAVFSLSVAALMPISPLQLLPRTLCSRQGCAVLGSATAYIVQRVTLLETRWRLGAQTQPPQCGRSYRDLSRLDCEV